MSASDAAPILTFSETDRSRLQTVVYHGHASACTCTRARESIAAFHCEVLFLPPYSPDLPPIEQAFSKIQALLRGLGAHPRDAAGGDPPGSGGHHSRRCGHLVRPRGLRPA
ncbi:MAG: transposase [Ktedonobacterales bacterium]|nr:transposase [Ktedonobacterales bacterium]